MEKESFEGCSVIFHDIKECYSSRELIICQFSIKEGIELSNLGDCCIGIFPVGWTSPQNCITQKAFSAAVIVSEKDFKLEFASSETKSSNFDDFFQFCFYNASNGYIHGASCPFQICDLKDMLSFVKDHQEEMSKSSNTTQEEWWLDELQHSMDGNDSSDDIVLVHNKTTLLEESLAKAFRENEILRNKVAAMEREHSEMQEDLTIEKQKYKNDLSEFSSMKMKFEALQNQEVSLKDTIKGSEDVIAYLTNQMEAMKSKMAAEYEEKIQCEADLNKKLILSLESKVQENQDMSAELEDFKLDFSKQLSETKRVYDEEMKGLLEEREKLKNVIRDQTKKYQSLEQDYKIESETYGSRILALEKALQTKTIANNQSVETELALQKLSTENKKLQEENELLKGKVVKLEQEITNTESKNNNLKLDKNHLEEVVSDLQKSIGISQKEKEEIKQKLSVITTEMTNKDLSICSLKETFEVMKNEIHDLNLKIAREQKINKELLEKISNFESQSEKEHSLPEHGSHHALQVASAHMQKQIRTIKAEKDKFQELYFNLKANGASSSKCDEKLRRENQELRTRLCLGKKDFDELAEKFKMMQRVGPPDILDNQITTKKPIADAVQQTDDVDGESVDELTIVKTLNKDLEEKVKTLEDENKKVNFSLEDMRERCKMLCEHYEGKIKLLEDENGSIKKQNNALLKGDAVFKESIIRSPNVTRTKDKKSERIPKVNPKEPNVVVKQPSAAEGIYLPPSIRMSRDNSLGAGLSAVLRTAGSRKSQHSVAQPPPVQVMPNRELNGRGPIPQRDNYRPKDERVSECPMCQLEFPVTMSDKTAADHVNGHFANEDN